LIRFKLRFESLTNCSVDRGLSYAAQYKANDSEDGHRSDSREHGALDSATRDHASRQGDGCSQVAKDSGVSSTHESTV
jgi:hypothetical protein